MGARFTKDEDYQDKKKREGGSVRRELAFSNAIELKNATLKSVEKFTFNDMTVDAKVVRVYDGDTCTCVFDTFGLGLYKHQVRLNGIDTAELKSSDLAVKALALRTRDYVSRLILNKIVKLKCEGTDKYGRILGVISVDDVCVNDELLEKNMAVVYDGGTKSGVQDLLAR